MTRSLTEPAESCDAQSSARNRAEELRAELGPQRDELRRGRASRACTRLGSSRTWAGDSVYAPRALQLTQRRVLGCNLCARHLGALSSQLRLECPTAALARTMATRIGSLASSRVRLYALHTADGVRRRRSLHATAKLVARELSGAQIVRFAGRRASRPLEVFFARLPPPACIQWRAGWRKLANTCTAPANSIWLAGRLLVCGRHMKSGERSRLALIWARCTQ